MLAMLLMAAAAAAAPSPTSVSPRETIAPAVNAAPAKASKVSGDTMICKSIATTGTRFMTRDCRTKGEWDQLAADSRQMTSDSQRGFTKAGPQ